MGAISLVLCGLFYSNLFGAVNIGTLISAFMVGFTLRQISNAYSKLAGRQINVVNNLTQDVNDKLFNHSRPILL